MARPGDRLHGFGFEELHDLVGHVRSDDGELLQVWQSIENPSKILCAHVRQIHVQNLEGWLRT